MFDLFIQGGWPMYPILACSMIALAVIAERTVKFILTWEDPNLYKNLAVDLISRVRESDTPCPGQDSVMQSSAAYQRLSGGNGPFSSMALCLVRHGHTTREEREEAVYTAGRKAMQVLQRRLGVLSVIAHLTPLMGLFGTVTGMIGMFQGLEVSGGSAEVAALSGGIWVALLTTAFGMAVAIPASAAYHFFDGIVGRREEQLQLFVEELEVLLFRRLSLQGSVREGKTAEGNA